MHCCLLGAVVIGILSILYVLSVCDVIFLQGNVKVLINHVKTNVFLCLEADHYIRSVMLIFKKIFAYIVHSSCVMLLMMTKTGCE